MNRTARIERLDNGFVVRVHGDGGMHARYCANLQEVYDLISWYMLEAPVTEPGSGGFPVIQAPPPGQEALEPKLRDPNDSSGEYPAITTKFEPVDPNLETKKIGPKKDPKGSDDRDTILIKITP